MLGQNRNKKHNNHNSNWKPPFPLTKCTSKYSVDSYVNWSSFITIKTQIPHHSLGVCG